MNFGFDKVQHIQATPKKSNGKEAVEDEKPLFSIYEDILEAPSSSSAVTESQHLAGRAPLAPLSREQVKLRSLRLASPDKAASRSKSPSPRSSVCMTAEEFEENVLTTPPLKKRKSTGSKNELSSIDDFKLEEEVVEES